MTIVHCCKLGITYTRYFMCYKQSDAHKNHCSLTVVVLFYEPAFVSFLLTSTTKGLAQCDPSPSYKRSKSSRHLFFLWHPSSAL